MPLAAPVMSTFLPATSVIFRTAAVYRNVDGREIGRCREPRHIAARPGYDRRIRSEGRDAFLQSLVSRKSSRQGKRRRNSRLAPCVGTMVAVLTNF